MNEGLLSPKPVNRGHHPNVAKIERNFIIEHVKSFKPTISHYRREHAPNRLYLPSDVNVTLMYRNFKEKFRNINFSYELYRKEVCGMNISFAKLGHEECFECEKFDIHCKSVGHTKSEPNSECENCRNWENHKQKYEAARTQYLKDVANEISIDEPNQITVSADLQKVIMLLRAEMFKEVIFIPRIIAFNESFVPVGKSRSTKPLAVIWHEGIAGRRKEDLISTFYSFLKKKNRDYFNTTIWLDNCAAQNKHWALYCFLFI